MVLQEGCRIPVQGVADGGECVWTSRRLDEGDLGWSIPYPLVLFEVKYRNS